MANRLVGIFGGSFNPIHNGHLQLSEYILHNSPVDEVWLMVSPQNPLKTAQGMLGERQRLQMATLATENIEGIKACGLELELPRPSYTWKTMEALTNKYPDTSFKIIIGADNWLLMPKWAKHEELEEKYGFIVYPRKGYDIGKPRQCGKTSFVNAPLYPYSSTDIRQRIALGQSIDGMVPPAVAGLIAQNNYYTNTK